MKSNLRHPLLFVLASVLAFGFASAQKDWKLPTVADRVLRELDVERQQAGVPGLDRRPDLDRVAAARAAEVAALPENRRLAYSEPLRRDLEAEGVRGYLHAEERTFLLKGVEPVEGVIRKWSEQPKSWATALDREMDAVGAAVVHADDEWIVFVAILLDDAPTLETVATMERQTFEAVNTIRLGESLPALEHDPGLAAVARAHSQDMARRDYMEHTSPEGKTVNHRVADAGIRFLALAENLAMHGGVRDPVPVAVDGWMQSRGHRRNILEARYNRCGIGIAVSADGRVYFTQIFLQTEP